MGLESLEEVIDDREVAREREKRQSRATFKEARKQCGALYKGLQMFDQLLNRAFGSDIFVVDARDIDTVRLPDYLKEYYKEVFEKHPNNAHLEIYIRFGETGTQVLNLRTILDLEGHNCRYESAISKISITVSKSGIFTQAGVAILAEEFTKNPLELSPTYLNHEFASWQEVGEGIKQLGSLQGPDALLQHIAVANKIFDFATFMAKRVFLRTPPDDAGK